MAIARCRFQHLQAQGVVKDEERAKPAHNSQTFQVAGLWFEHLGCLLEVAAFAAVGHCRQCSGLESITLALNTGAQPHSGRWGAWEGRLIAV